MERKSLKIGFPKMVPKKYLPDFIRGLWDGDGCVSYKKQGKHYISCFSSASKALIYGLLDVIIKKIPSFTGKIIFYNNLYTLNACANDTRRLRDFLYKNINENSLFLKRKYEKFQLAGDICIASYNKKFIDYKHAQKIVRSLNIRTQDQWKKYRLKNNKIEWPSVPDVTYKNKGWVNWETFTGNKFWDFETAKKFVGSLKIKTHREWQRYATSGKKIDNIPSNPWRFYKKEWTGLHEWLGIK